jgi:phosphatidylglycerophosphatase A
LVLLACGLGLGYARHAPGTFGTLLGLPLAWAMGLLPWWWQVGAIVLICAAGIPLCTYAARRLNAKDPGAIVFDEIASLPITFFLVSLSRPAGELAAVLAAGFVLHRLFDITKPPPARQLERLPTGLGIMADDWSAGIYSCLVLHGLLWAIGW